jgi:hypothetical protein
MLKFGSANNLSGQIGEHALKGIVKDHAKRIQQRPDNFAEQCAIWEYESNVIKYVMTDLVQVSAGPIEALQTLIPKESLRCVSVKPIVGE